MNFRVGLAGWLGASVWLSVMLLVFSSDAGAATISELFLRLPDSQCGGLSPADRGLMLDRVAAAQKQSGRSRVQPIPDVEYPWVVVESDNYLTLNRPTLGPVNFKLFDSLDGFQLLVVCRGRQRSSPSDPACEFDLCFFRVEGQDLVEVHGSDYLPSISVLDFITPATLEDPRAVRDLMVIGQTFNSCLTCNASNQDATALDILTVTNLNSQACEGFLAPYGLLPLTWDGQVFSKPYDRGVPAEAQSALWNQKTPTGERAVP